jgi:hypothetical protein
MEDTIRRDSNESPDSTKLNASKDTSLTKEHLDIGNQSLDSHSSKAQFLNQNDQRHRENGHSSMNLNATTIAPQAPNPLSYTQQQHMANATAYQNPYFALGMNSAMPADYFDLSRMPRNSFDALADFNSFSRYQQLLQQQHQLQQHQQLQQQQQMNNLRVPEKIDPSVQKMGIPAVPTNDERYQMLYEREARWTEVG